MLSHKFVWSAILALVFVLLFALSALADQPEQPEHSINVQASACLVSIGNPVIPAGYVDFGVSSWANESPKGDNPDILVQYQIELQNGQVSGYRDLMHGSFTADGHYRFASTIYITGDVKRLSLIVTALGEWGDGFAGGQMTVLDLFPVDCDGTTSDPVEGEPMNNRLFLPNVQRSMVPWLLLVAPVVLLGAAARKCPACGSEFIQTRTNDTGVLCQCQSCSHEWVE